jgi:hypothetical protein
MKKRKFFHYYGFIVLQDAIHSFVVGHKAWTQLDALAFQFSGQKQPAMVSFGATPA